MSAARPIAAVRGPAPCTNRTLTSAEHANAASPSLLGTPVHTPGHRHMHRNPPASQTQTRPSALKSSGCDNRNEQEEDPFGPLKRSVSRRVGKPLEPLRPSMSMGYGNVSSVLEDSWSDGEDEADEGDGEEEEQEDEEGGLGSSGAEKERLFGGDARGVTGPGREVAQKAGQMLGVKTGAPHLKKAPVQARAEDAKGKKASPGYISPARLILRKHRSAKSKTATPATRTPVVPPLSLPPSSPPSSPVYDPTSPTCSRPHRHHHHHAQHQYQPASPSPLRKVSYTLRTPTPLGMLKDTEEDTDAAMETKRQLLFSPFRPSDSRAEQDRANVMRTMGSSMSALPTPRPRVQPLGLSQRGNILSNQLDATSTSSLASPLKRPAARAQLFQTQPQSPLSQSAARARARVHPRPLAPAGTEIAVTQMDTQIPTQTQAETQIQTQAKTRTHRPMRGRLTSTPLDSRVFRDGKWWDIGSVPPGTPTPLGLGPPMRLSKDQSSNLVSTPSPGRTRGFAQEAV